MTEGNETPIGAVRTDGTEKEEATVLRAFAQFAKSASAHLVNPKRPEVAIITSQAAQFPRCRSFKSTAQRRAVRALAYGSRIEPYVIAENQIAKLGRPKLAILPIRAAPCGIHLACSARICRIRWPAPHHRPNQPQRTFPIRRSHLPTETRRERRTAHLSRKPPSRSQFRKTGLARSKQNAQPNTANLLTLNFGQNVQNWLESERFSDNATYKEISYGQGKNLLDLLPRRALRRPDSTTQLYNYVLHKISLKPAYELLKSVSSGVLIYLAPRPGCHHVYRHLRFSQ